jgi:hypothetical protein
MSSIFVESDPAVLLARFQQVVAESQDVSHFEQAGWTATMIDGIRHFIPPRWIDPQQKPIPNRTHNPEREVNPLG